VADYDLKVKTIMVGVFKKAKFYTGTRGGEKITEDK
jgi:hypothetical protein